MRGTPPNKVAKPDETESTHCQMELTGKTYANTSIADRESFENEAARQSLPSSTKTLAVTTEAGLQVQGAENALQCQVIGQPLSLAALPPGKLLAK